MTSADVIDVDISGQTDPKNRRKPDGENEIVTKTDFDPIHHLNRYTFHNTILEEHSDAVPHWIVLFCPPWYEPCQALEPVFRELSHKWQAQLNSALLSTEVRFAAVDCATEKALCNTQNVVTYPFVAHYRNRVQEKVWRGKSFDTDKKRLTQFLQKELGPLASAVSMAVDSEDVKPEDAQQSFPVDFLLIFAAIAGNAWFISRGGFGTEVTSAPCSKQSMEGGPASGPVLPAMPQANQQASCVERSLPKEWGRDRASFEL